MESYLAHKDDGYGVIVGTVSAKPAPLNPPWYEWSRYDFRSTDGHKAKGHVTSAYISNPFHMWGSMPLCADDGLEDECGHVFAIHLPAGEYEFTYVTPASMSKVSDSGFVQDGWASALHDYRFVVRPGMVTYLGNLVSRICIGRRHGYIASSDVLSAVGGVRDMYGRDLPLIMAKFPVLKATEISNQTIPGQPWVWRYKQEKGYQPPYSWPDECSVSSGVLPEYLKN